jgi:hypothetical protein
MASAFGEPPEMVDRALPAARTIAQALASSWLFLIASSSPLPFFSYRIGM